MITALFFFTHAFETTHLLHSSSINGVTRFVASSVVRPFSPVTVCLGNDEHYFFL